MGSDRQGQSRIQAELVVGTIHTTLSNSFLSSCCQHSVYFQTKVWIPSYCNLILFGHLLVKCLFFPNIQDLKICHQYLHQNGPGEWQMTNKWVKEPIKKQLFWHKHEFSLVWLNGDSLRFWLYYSWLQTKWSKWGLQGCSSGQDVFINEGNLMVGIHNSGDKVA